MEYLFRFYNNCSNNDDSFNNGISNLDGSDIINTYLFHNLYIFIQANIMRGTSTAYERMYIHVSLID